MIDVSQNALYVIDLMLVAPALWVVAYLIAGAVSFNGARFVIGWPFCWIALLIITVAILRVSGEIA